MHVPRPCAEDIGWSAFDTPGDVPARPFDACYWLLADRLLAGEHPGAAHLRALQGAGVTRFIDLTSPPDPVQPYSPLPVPGKTVLRESHPIADFAVPSAQTMHAVLDSIHASLGRQERIYLHCRAGIGRTGTVAGCLLVDFGLSGAEALALLQRKWKSTRRSTTDPHTPETTAQHAFVLAWRARAHPCGADAAARQSPRESAIEGN